MYPFRTIKRTLFRHCVRKRKNWEFSHLRTPQITPSLVVTLSGRRFTAVRGRNGPSHLRVHRLLRRHLDGRARGELRALATYGGEQLHACYGGAVRAL